MNEEKSMNEAQSTEKELVALPKSYAQKMLQRLVEENKEVFDEYVMWQNVLQSDVKITETSDDEDVKEPMKEDSAKEVKE